MAENRQTPLTEFKSGLTCPLCKELFKEPKTLDCLHTFCEECLLKHITELTPDSKSTGDGTKNIPCPLCQNVQTLPAADVKKVTTNHSFKNMINHLSLEERVRTACSSGPDRANSKCDECDEEKNAVAFCKTCNEHLCDNCSEAHKRSKRFKTHQVSTLEEICSSSCQDSGPIVSHYTWKCSRHDDHDPDEKSSELTDVHVYCKPCDELICSKCAIVEPHGNHEKYEASKAINDPECKPKIQEHMRELKQVHEKFTTSIAKMEDLKEDLNKNRKKAEREIEDKFQDLYAKLEKEKKVLLKNVEDTFEKENTKFTEQLEELKKIEEELSESQKFVNGTLTFGIPEEVLFLKTQMIARMKHLHNKYKDHPHTPCAVVDVKFELDLKGVITAMGGYTGHTTAICCVM